MMTVHRLQPFQLPYQEYQEDTPSLSNVLNVPVGQEEPAGQVMVTLVTSKLDREVDVVNEQAPVVVEQVGHVKSSLGRVYDHGTYPEMVDVVKVEQAPVEQVKVDVATELAGQDDHVEVVVEPASNSDQISQGTL